MKNTAGNAQISSLTLLAILSLSLIVNLPGLAVTPMLSTLSDIFPGTTETEKQLLTSIPNLVIIPFLLLSGKLSLTRHKTATIVAALVIFTAAAIAYFFAKSMNALIVISCLLGAGAGLLIPFAAGLVADCFSGPERMKVMGWKSGVSNLSLVVATYAVGWLSAGNWHLPFAVYLLCLIPLALSPQLRKIPDPKMQPLPRHDVPKSEEGDKTVDGFFAGKMAQILAVYFFITFATMVISYYSPFLIKAHHLPDTLTGTVTALYFLFIFLPGFLLPKIVKAAKGATMIAAGMLATAGLAMFALHPQPWSMCVGACLAGLGYGIIQPLVYDKASRAVASPRKATMALSIVLTANYVSIALAPFIVDGFRSVLHAHSEVFPFALSAVLLAAYAVLSMLLRRSFAFSVSKTFYQ